MNNKNISSNKKEKNIKKEKTELFDRFYLSFPKKVAKENAKKAFYKLTDKEQEIAIENVQNVYAPYVKRVGLEKKFIPHPATWLNGKRWEDELVELKKEDERKQKLKELKIKEKEQERLEDDKKRAEKERLDRKWLALTEEQKNSLRERAEKHFEAQKGRMKNEAFELLVTGYIRKELALL